MRKITTRIVLILLSGCILFTTACTQNGGGQERQKFDANNFRPFNTNTINEPKKLNSETEQVTIQLTEHQGKNYVSLDKLVDALQFNSVWDEESQSFNIGDHDVVFEVKLGTTQVEKENEPISLSSAPISIEGSTFIPEEALSKLFKEEMNYEIREQQLIIYPSSNENVVEGQGTNDTVEFGEDPNDPFAGDDAADDEEGINSAKEISDVEPLDEEVWNSFEEDAVTAATLKNIDINAMIRTGKKYLGVDYKFGAKKYSRSRRFDCSSYTQQLYGTYGVKLNRLARNQAKQGNRVSAKSLRKGDLLYFYVPGRFKSNKTVGHVGIYIGNMRMLHSAPAPKNGVQITNLNSGSYWKKTFLGAKRVVK